MSTQSKYVKEVEFRKFTHELNNSLTICNGYLKMIPSRTKYLNKLQKEIERSLNIIREYKESKFSVLNKEVLDLTYLLEEVIDTVIPLYDTQTKIIFNKQKECYLVGDYEKLKQVFINLLKNAYEAKQEILLIYIKITSYSSFYKIVIEDNGIGMSQEEIQRIGEEYYTTKSYGTGLGVSYCKEILKKHSGSISYHSIQKKGTKVSIILPKEKSPKTFNSSNCY